MKTNILSLALIATMCACGNEPKGSDDDKGKVDSTKTSMNAEGYKPYGAVVSPDGAMAMTDFAKATTSKDSLDAKVQCEMITSCARKGCWMDVKLPNGTPMKVRFKDYAFFVPTGGLAGKQAVIQGHAVKEVTDVATLRHYAEDAGKSKDECERITQADTSWSFMADGVLIKQ